MTKEWDDPDSVLGPGVSADVDITCENLWDGQSLYTASTSTSFDYVDGDETFAYIPGGSANPDTDDDAPQTHCWAEEVGINNTSVSSDQGCLEGVVYEWGGDLTQECTIINTVVFEGIPALSRQGLALLALLMLGVGFIGFRRFT